MATLRRRVSAISSLVRSAVGATEVERYWTGHTVNSTPFGSAAESEEYLQWRFDEYPLFREKMALWGDHDGDVILDYGCGPGNDLVGFLLYTACSRVVGADVSPKSLELARGRLDLHRLDVERYSLVRLLDSRPAIPSPDSSVDFVHCAGVLQHTTDPAAILGELRRVVRPDASGRVMVYNRDSLWFHLYTAYQRMIVQGMFGGLSVEEAFARNTDGPDCPISRCYRSADFVALAESEGFGAEYLGGYFARIELDLYRDLLGLALSDDRLDRSHRDFLGALAEDDQGYPCFQGEHAGIGGVYRIWPTG
ncbi:MAG TPA: class I SAM-dependent methyltransferase [Gaiellaceae bacterium]|jgi:ubiquinone/menaquinone biosynthesis C-methylase UbiE